MNKKYFSGILYVSILIMVWGTIGSLIDYPLLKSNLYLEGSLGQLMTFSLTGIIFVFIGIKVFPFFEKNIMNNEV